MMERICFYFYSNFKPFYISQKFEKRNLNQITGATATAPPRPNQPPQVRGLAGMGAGIPSPPARSTSCFESLEQRFHFLSIDELPPPPKFQGFRKVVINFIYK